MTLRRLVRLAVVSAVVAATSMAVTTVVSASPAFAFGSTACPHGGNQISTACFYGEVQYGDYTEFRNNNMYFTNVSYEQAGGHINHTLWSYSGAPCQYWQETGLTQGYHGQVAYLWYWAYNNTTQYQDFPAGYTSPNGSLHSYEVLFDGNGTYTAYRDFGAVGTTGGLGAGSCIAQTGLEVSYGEMPVTHSDTFTMNPLQWENTAGTWYYGWNTGEFWIDNPCGHGYSPPNCANGNFTNSNQWNDNKP